MYIDKSESISELIVRCILLIYYIITSSLKPRVREIHDEEWWLYMNPTGTNHIPFTVLMILIIVNTLVFPLTVFLIYRKRNSVIINGLLGYSLAVALNISITNTLKLLVGRPRPDFYFRCFTDGKKFSICNGDEEEINEGLKSFPSGHSSMSMAAFGFTSLFLIGQLRLFAKQKLIIETDMNTGTVAWKHLEVGRFLGCKLMVCLVPVFFAVLVCVSRLLDFHHHFDDIIFGASIGLLVAWLCYRLYFPSVFSSKSHCPRFDYEIVRSRKTSSKPVDTDFLA